MAPPHDKNKWISFYTTREFSFCVVSVIIENICFLNLVTSNSRYILWHHNKNFNFYKFDSICWNLSAVALSCKSHQQIPQRKNTKITIKKPNKYLKKQHSVLENKTCSTMRYGYHHPISDVPCYLSFLVSHVSFFKISLCFLEITFVFRIFFGFYV